MSDLCHNCGDCHLGSQPRPCPQNLQECIICKNWGHTFNFCPLSVRLIDKNYEYFMICHNCDRWHLPRPCDFAMVTCSNCQNIGHLPTFCPLYPNARLRPLGDSMVVNTQLPDGITGGQNPESCLEMSLVQDITKVHPDLLGEIQTQAISALYKQDASRIERSIMPAYRSIPESATLMVQHQHAHSFSRPMARNSLVEPPDQRLNQQYQPADAQDLPTPMPSSAIKPGFIVAAADTFAADGSDIFTPNTHAPNSTESPNEIATGLPVPEAVKELKSGRKTRSQTMPCAKCKRAKKRCRHTNNDTMSSTSVPGTDEIEVSQPKAKKPKLSLDSELVHEYEEKAKTIVTGTTHEHTNDTVDQRVDHGGQADEAQQAIMQPLDSVPTSGHGQSAGYEEGQLAAANARGIAKQYDWLQGTVNATQQIAGTTTNSNVDAYQNMFGSGMYTQNLPSIQHAMAASDYNSGVYSAQPSHINSYMEVSGTTRSTSANAPVADYQPFFAAQSGSHRSGDIFSFGDHGTVDSYRERHQSMMGVQHPTESPSGQIQYEPTSSMDSNNIAPDETESAPKPKKAASKRKGGRKSKK